MNIATAERLTRRAKADDLELQELRRFHAELLRYATMRRYRTGWVRRTFRERFRLQAPAEWARDEQAAWIRPDTYAWIRGRAAAYARAIESGRRQ